MKEAHALPGSFVFSSISTGCPVSVLCSNNFFIINNTLNFHISKNSSVPLIFNSFEINVSLVSTSFFYLEIKYVVFFHFTRCLYIISDDESTFFPHPVTRLVLGKIKENEYN